MTRTVTVGVDGSPESRAAADWAAREALLRKLPLRIVHVWNWAPYTFAPGALSAEAERHWAERIPREVGTDISGRHPGLEVSAERFEGETATTLLAASKDAEVLALGSRGLGAMVGFLVGSVAMATVARAERPVVLVRAGERAQDEYRAGTGAGTGDEPAVGTAYRNVVLGLDLARPDDDVIGHAFEAAARRETGLRVVHTWSPPTVYDFDPGLVGEEVMAELASRATTALAEVLRSWRGKYPQVPVFEQVLTGRPGERLVAASADASLVVVGRRVRSSPLGAHTGSVAHAVIHHATAPVAVVPHE
ncbi:universal stress protein [Streptomyces daliensis]|uniref:Universal stress protein n=1 Tax=Streptomyces daliensis TaxID=299421 RepID=A0A8T4INZ7_9ACTN|nr:universal stress protein [Streptomyces daliensis]